MRKDREPRSETERQTTDTVVMIYPDTFKFNPETAASNDFQRELGEGITPEQANLQARNEFENEVGILRQNGINVMVMHSVEGVDTPDAVFPNNWLSFHDGFLVLYPMRNSNRSLERQPQNLIDTLQKNYIKVPKIIDLTQHELLRKNIENTVELKDGKETIQILNVCTEALEGTGSMVLDRVNRIAYATESVRTTPKVFEEWCRIMDYKGILFHSTVPKIDKKTNKIIDSAIYHTNVVMGIGEKFVVVSLETINDPVERETVSNSLRASGRELIEITRAQVDKYCGNVLELKSVSGEPKIVMSKTSYDAFTPEQISKLENFGKILPLKIKTIETIGGGSARCTIAEVY